MPQRLSLRLLVIYSNTYQMMMKKMILGAFAFVMLCSCGNRQQGGQMQFQLPEYPIAVVQPENVTLETVYPVNIRGQVDVEVRPRIDGFIQDIYIEEGSPVRKGQSLFKIDSPSAEQGLISAEAALNSAQANLNTARINVDRMRPLAEKKIISVVQLQTYENQYEAALAAYSQAEAALSQARSVLSWTNVISPVDGMAGDIPYRQGNLVSSSNVLTTIADTRNVYAYFSLNEKQLLELLNSLDGTTQAEKIKSLPAVTLTLANGALYPYKGEVETIAGVVNNVTGSATLRAKFPNPEGVLRSGTSGRVSIPRELDNVFRIPQKATTSLQDKVMVYKVQGDSVVRTVITVLPTPDGSQYAVTGGLAAGDRIVTDGVATLQPGKKIKVD